MALPAQVQGAPGQGATVELLHRGEGSGILYWRRAALVQPIREADREAHLVLAANPGEQVRARCGVATDRPALRLGRVGGMLAGPLTPPLPHTHTPPPMQPQPYRGLLDMVRPAPRVAHGVGAEGLEPLRYEDLRLGGIYECAESGGKPSATPGARAVAYSAVVLVRKQRLPAMRPDEQPAQPPKRSEREQGWLERLEARAGGEAGASSSGGGAFKAWLYAAGAKLAAAAGCAREFALDCLACWCAQGTSA